MKDKQNINIQIEYGDKKLKDILVELLKEEYINYIVNQKE